jgi:hypothetical protein
MTQIALQIRAEPFGSWLLSASFQEGTPGRRVSRSRLGETSIPALFAAIDIYEYSILFK